MYAHRYCIYGHIFYGVMVFVYVSPSLLHFLLTVIESISSLAFLPHLLRPSSAPALPDLTRSSLWQRSQTSEHSHPIHRRVLYSPLQGSISFTLEPPQRPINHLSSTHDVQLSLYILPLFKSPSSSTDTQAAPPPQVR